MKKTDSLKFLILQNSSIFGSFGGIEYYLDDFASIAVETCGYDNVWILAPKKTPVSPVIGIEYKYSLIELEKSLFFRKIRNRFSINYIRNAFKIINEFKPDILVCGHISLCPLVFYLSKKFSIPYITICYGIECWGNLWPQDKFALKHSSLIISISFWTKKILVKQNYFLENNILVLHPHLPTSYETVIPKKHSIDKEELVLLSVSRLDAKERYKGQDHVLFSISKLKNKKLKLKYLIQGEGSDRKRLEELSKNLGLLEEVTFIPSLSSRDSLIPIYKSADVFILPSRFGRWNRKWHGEGFGIVFLEAAACGIPSIAYDCGGVTDIIKNGENGILVKQDDLDALSAAIEELYFNRSKLVSLSEEALRTVMEKFKRKNSKEEFLKILSHCESI